MGPRARDAFIVRMTMAGDWHVDVEDRTPLTLLTVLAGSCSVERGGAVVTAAQGEVLVVHGSAPYAVRSGFRDGPTPPESCRSHRVDRFTVHPGQECTGPDGQHVREELRRGVRVWGSSPDGPDQLLVGTFTSTSAVAELVLEGVSLARVDDEETLGWAQLLAREAERERPTQPVVLDRLLDILTVHAVEHVSAAAPERLGPPAISAAVSAMWARPAQPWTVSSLAHLAAMSRSAFSQSFTEALGAPPITYLTRIRLALAADALRDTDATLARIASDVGYASPFALSSAFRRRYEMSPAQLRAAAARGG